MENSGKLENQLNLAIDSTEEERNKTMDLNVGYDSETKQWELILKYVGDLEEIEENLNLSFVKLLNHYATVVIPENKIDLLAKYEQIIYIEKPKQLNFIVEQGIRLSCIEPVQIKSDGLFGEGVLVGIVDSGIDYAHPDFIDDDGNTRIVSLWDQSKEGNPPDGYHTGSVYMEQEINDALSQMTRDEQKKIVPVTDLSGHGTHVAGIACGNGRGSDGKYKGVASKSKMIVVKMGSSVGNSFPRTTQLIEGVDYCIRQAIAMKKPMAVNISFGNNYGAHNGRSLMETYLNDAMEVWKLAICAGAGNEGVRAGHTSGMIENGKETKVEFVIPGIEKTINVQLWKDYRDEIEIFVENPNGIRIGPISETVGSQKITLEDTDLFIYYGSPLPFNRMQEIYFDFIPKKEFIASGNWKIDLKGKKITSGKYDLWLPSGDQLLSDTKFVHPTLYDTLTIPSTASQIITVGAYDSITDSYAGFSGRGIENAPIFLNKPDLAAPGVGIISAAPGGGYTAKTGTSMAAPFVTGAAALLLEWGIVKKNDPYLYGEKLKAYLIKGARPLSGFRRYPNPQVGWGALCLSESIPKEKK